VSEKSKKLAFVDIETTGTNFLSDRIIEISILVLENDKLINSFTTLINPETSLSPFITGITGINSKDLEKSPTFFDVHKEIEEILNNCVIVAHNVRFDYGFIKTEFKRLGKNFRSKTLCTVKLSRYFYPQFINHNLDSIISRHGFECLHRHRAYDDAKVLVDFYHYLKANFSHKKLTKALNFVQKKSSLPSFLKSDSYDDLPETPGVYIFYGNNDIPLYIGKSVNIKIRVLSHFQNSSSSNHELQLFQQLKSIKTIDSAGDLTASILESRLIKELKPLHNRQLRSRQEFYLLKQIKTSDNYYSVNIEKTKNIKLEDIDNLLGIFNSKRKVQNFLITVAKEYNLCPKLLTLDHSKNSCFSYHLGDCFGACINEEHFLKYNLRFMEAFSHRKIKKWPFDSPVMITETNHFNGLTQKIILDNWCLLAVIKSTPDIADNDTEIYETNFDYDIYKIIKKALKNDKNIFKISKIDKEDITNLLA
jgi:DNA polymerase-3 subunit epsilon